MRGFVLVFLKAGSSPVQLEGDFFHNASIRTSVFKSHVVSRTCQSETLGEATTQLTRLEGVQQHPRVPGPSPGPVLIWLTPHNTMLMAPLSRPLGFARHLGT